MFRKRYLKELTGAKPSAAVDKLHQLASAKSQHQQPRANGRFLRFDIISSPTYP
jgi:hypothetical protein